MGSSNSSEVPLKCLNKTSIDIGEDFSILMECSTKILDTNNAEGVYFVRRKPKEDGEKEKENEIDILFHLSFKSSKEISLMTYEGITMKKEVIMTYDNVDEKLCGKPFELVIRLLRDEPEIPLVFINEEFLTAYESKNDITCTEYIGFTSGLRVCASEIKR